MVPENLYRAMGQLNHGTSGCARRAVPSPESRQLTTQDMQRVLIDPEAPRPWDVEAGSRGVGYQGAGGGVSNQRPLCSGRSISVASLMLETVWLMRLYLKILASGIRSES